MPTKIQSAFERVYEASNGQEYDGDAFERAYAEVAA